MMKIRIMRMLVGERLVTVPVRVGLARGIIGLVRVPVMLVVDVSVSMLETVVVVHVIVPFAQVQV